MSGSDSERDEIRSEWSELDWGQVYATLRDLAPVVLRGFPRQVTNDLDDIVQDVVIKLHDAQLSGKLPPMSRPQGYLGMLLRWRAIDRLRALRRQRTFEKLEAVTDSLAVSQDEERKRRQVLWNALKDRIDKLPDDERLLFLRFYLGGVSIKELAKEANVKYSTMAQRLHRIKERLKSQMADSLEP